MDKYTVDLDQVLNDFEYSELTTEFDNVTGNKQFRNPLGGSSTSQQHLLHHHHQQQQQQQLAFKNTNVKHSINNVFHSLNEYLNTEIGAKIPPPIETTTITTTTVSIVTETTSKPTNNLVDIEIKPETITVTPGNSENNVESPWQPNDVKTIESEESIIKDKTDLLITTTTTTTTTNNNSNIDDDDDDNNSSIGTIDGDNDKNDVGDNDDVIIGDVDNNLEPAIVLDHDQSPGEREEEVDEGIGEDNLEQMNNEDGGGGGGGVVEGEMERKIEDGVIKVGFDDELFDVDEAELTRYLDELEKELEPSESVEAIPPPPQLEEKEVVVIVAPPVEVVVVVVEDGEKTIELNSEELDNEINENNNNNNDSSSNENQDGEEVVAIVTEPVIETIERPNNLPLLPTVECEETPVKPPVINLIGDPGSTPYNNVYINRELPGLHPKTIENSDTECSTSASPTFSDISTETTSSCTQSEDNHPPENSQPIEKNPKKTENNSNDGGDNTDNSNIINQETGEEQEIFHDAVESHTNNNSINNNNDDIDDLVLQHEDEEPAQQQQQQQLRRRPLETTYPSNETPPLNSNSWLGKQAPLWVPDGEATNCLHCDLKFTVLKRRHHCRACGLVLCSKCCNSKWHLDYLDTIARVCTKCYEILSKEGGTSSIVPNNSLVGNTENCNNQRSQPNPNNPLEYCSTVPPHQQVGTSNPHPPAVMVPVGVLKRQGATKVRSNKSVMFCDGIRPGSDLTNLDADFAYPDRSKLEEVVTTFKMKPELYTETKSYIPVGDDLPPLITVVKTDISYTECENTPEIVEKLKNESLSFCIQLNLIVHLKIVNMDCCINKTAWCFSTEGLINVGQDEIVILLEVLDDEKLVPKEVFLHLNNIFLDAVKGTSVKEMGLSLHSTSNFLGSKNHAGFVFIRPSFQCLENVIKPQEPYLIGILIHRWETPWAKLFPLRLILRLGAEYRYYPSPIISNRFRDSVFVEIGHTIINLLADFRNFSYTLPQIRGLIIHIEEKNTTVTIPANRYDQVMKSLSNSSDHILAFAGNFSNQADSHLVCIQDTQSNDNAYSTHAINIHNKPRKVTGASFIVFNGALKPSSGLTAKSSIVEDGLMIQILNEDMLQIRENLRNMKNYTIQCGYVNATSDETVSIVWGEADTNFNLHISSPIDGQEMNGIPSIRVHNGKDYVCNSGNRMIRWTEVFIIQQNENDNGRNNQEPVDISKVSESIAKATCNALVKYLDLLVTNNFYKIAIRTTLHVDNVSYSAGSNSMKLPPIYMKSLDNELVPVLHRITSNNFSENAIILELIFRILNK